MDNQSQGFYYAFLVFACLLSGARLALNKIYVNRYGSALRSAVWFLFLCCGTFFLLLLGIERHVDFSSWFSVLLAVIFAVINVGCTAFGFVTIGIGNVSTYTLVLMLGGMIVPFFYGITLGTDTNTWAKSICMVLIMIALFLGTERKGDKKSSRKAFFCYALLFTLNGLACVIISMHEQDPTPFGARAVEPSMFTMLYMLFTAILALIVWIVLRIKDGKESQPVKCGPGILLACLSGVFYGFGNLISSICVGKLGPAAQYPILTGGNVIISGLVGLFFKEKIKWRFVAAASLIMIGMLLLACCDSSVKQ